jgi:hypothetical protein
VGRLGALEAAVSGVGDELVGVDRALAAQVGHDVGVGVSAASASATDLTHCNQVVSPGNPCPDFYGGARHTYYNERTSWSTSINYSCGVDLTENMVYDSSPPSPPGSTKYHTEGFCYITMSFPSNTELLRGFSQQWDGPGLNWWLVGKAAY